MRSIEVMGGTEEGRMGKVMAELSRRRTRTTRKRILSSRRRTKPSEELILALVLLKYSLSPALCLSEIVIDPRVSSSSSSSSFAMEVRSWSFLTKESGSLGGGESCRVDTLCWTVWITFLRL